MHINFDFKDLELFLSVLETGSFQKAGERLGLSQPAVTRRIQKLETELESVLFERTTRHMHPTLAAKRLRVRAEAIMEDIRETSAALRDESVAYAHQRNAVVTVAAIPTVIGRLFPLSIRRLHAQGHGARIRILDGSANDVAEAVSQGEADFGVAFMPSEERRVDFEILFDDKIVLAFPADHPLAESDGVSWTELDRLALIMPARGTGNRLLIDDAMARARLPLNWTFEASRTTTSLDLVAGGAGVAVLPRSALMSRGSRHIRYHVMSEPEISRPIGLITRPGGKDRPVVSALLEAMRETSAANGKEG